MTERIKALNLALDTVEAQLDHLNIKHGDNSAEHATSAQWLPIAIEELGEISTAQQDADHEHEYVELAQLASCCIARMIGIDVRGER